MTHASASSGRTRARRAGFLHGSLALLAAGSAVLAAMPARAAADYAAIPPTAFTSVIETGPDARPVQLAGYAMRTEPVTNAEFLAFVQAHPEWQRGKAPAVFADARYLAHWAAADRLGADALPAQPVTQVSWFAAQAYCEAEGARLPTWLEWERAAAASQTEADARRDSAWRQRLLDWYGRPSRGALDQTGGEPNLYGVRDLHGLVWEWVDDYNALMVTSDSRDQNDPDRLKFCGSAALSLRDRDNYALLMRVAMLSSLQAVDTTVNLGFRCVRPGASP